MCWYWRWPEPGLTAFCLEDKLPPYGKGISYTAVSLKVRIRKADHLYQVFRFEDPLFSQWMYLTAMLDYIDHGGRS